MKPDTLLMFSGGLDSTGAFWQLKDKKIHIHHMHLKNIENRSLAESKSVIAILEYMKQFCDFSYSESTHEYPTYNGSFIWDGDLSNFMAGTICGSMPYLKFVAFGKTASDIKRSAVNSRIEKGNKIFTALCKSEKTYPVEHLTKIEIYNMLPQELRDLTWSCRKPIYQGNDILPCKKCITCEDMRKIGIKPQIQLCQSQ